MFFNINVNWLAYKMPLVKEKKIPETEHTSAYKMKVFQVGKVVPTLISHGLNSEGVEAFV